MSTVFQNFDLRITTLPSTDLHVVAMQGTESISDLYAFEIWFTAHDPIEPTHLIGQTASLTLSTGGENFEIAGIVVQFDCDDPTPVGDFVFHMVIGAQLGLTKLNRQNQIYGTETAVSLADLISGKLDNSLSAKSTSGGESTSIAFDLRLINDYPQRDYVAQFEESDFDFLSRRCEHHGVFYFFEFARGQASLVFGDSNQAFGAAAGPNPVPFRPTRGQADDVAIASFRASAKPVPRRVFVRDYDDMQAATELLASQIVDDQGYGTLVEYGPNFTSMTTGQRFARIRAEEAAMPRLVFRGSGTAPGLRPGSFFTLSDHPNPALNQRYIVTAATHRAGDTGSRNGPYENSFEAMAFDTPYRPRRKTQRPIAAGLSNAVIDSAGDGSRADLDRHGRYKLRQIYDEAQSPPGRASNFIRKAEPYAGKDDTGLHMPLRKETEVVVGYVNGDPDRPVILGAIANSANPNVVKKDNQASNRLRTPAGGLFEINDGSPKSGGGGKAQS